VHNTVDDISGIHVETRSDDDEVVTVSCCSVVDTLSSVIVIVVRVEVVGASSAI
jgi:hypothetical protein